MSIFLLYGFPIGAQVSIFLLCGCSYWSIDAYLPLIRVFPLVHRPLFSSYKGVPIGLQVLCDPVLRQRYDENGKSGVDKEEFMDTKAFFEMSFGSEAFEHLVGVLVCSGKHIYGGFPGVPVFFLLQRWQNVFKRGLNRGFSFYPILFFVVLTSLNW